MSTLYEQDFHAWCFQQVDLLSEGKLEKLDVKHVIEEMIAVGNREKSYLESNLIVLIMHLLKWEYQKGSYIFEYQHNSWLNSIKEHRKRVERIFIKEPSLKAWLPNELESIYGSARYEAYKETGLPIKAFPEEMPWTWDQVMSDGWLPNEGR